MSVRERARALAYFRSKCSFAPTQNTHTKPTTRSIQKPNTIYIYTINYIKYNYTIKTTKFSNIYQKPDCYLNVNTNVQFSSSPTRALLQISICSSVIIGDRTTGFSICASVFYYGKAVLRFLVKL